MTKVIEFIENKLAMISTELADLKKDLPKMVNSKIFDSLCMQNVQLQMRIADLQKIKELLQKEVQHEQKNL